MKTTMKIQAVLFCALLVPLVSKAEGDEMDCSKFTESLCTSVNAKTNADTLYVNIFFRLPTDDRTADSSCKNIDIRDYPDSPCNRPAYDSVFWKKLKAETEFLFNKYTSMMMDVRNPASKFEYPGDSIGGFMGAIVTKADLIQISKDTAIITIEPWFYSQPSTLRARFEPEHAGARYSDFLVNGQIKSGRAKVRSYGARVRRQQ